MGRAKSYAERLFDFPDDRRAVAGRRARSRSPSRRSTSGVDDRRGRARAHPRARHIAIPISCRSGASTRGMPRPRRRSRSQDVERASPYRDRRARRELLSRALRPADARREDNICARWPSSGRGRIVPATSPRRCKRKVTSLGADPQPADRQRHDLQSRVTATRRSRCRCSTRSCSASCRAMTGGIETAARWNSGSPTPSPAASSA